MKASVIITLYKNLPFIDLILQSLALQTEKDFELIIAEDDDLQESKIFLNAQRKKYHFPILHCSHSNSGFRKNKILNQAILKSNEEYLIFVDGDCVLHPQFISEHLKAAKPNQTILGRRLMLSKKLTELVLKENSISRLNFINFIKYGCEKLECGFYFPMMSSNRKSGLWGHNWSTNKNQLIGINGFDEDYVKGGKEDDDVEWRLRKSGSSFISVKFKAIQYHLHHPINYNKDDVIHNTKVLEFKQKQNLFVCKNGIQKL